MAKHFRSLRIAGPAAMLVAAATPQLANALTIVPTFGAGATAGYQAAVNTAIQYYQNTFSDAVTVQLRFNGDESVGLGQSTFNVFNVGYTNFRSGLVADASSADDALAILSSVPAGANNPINGSSNFYMKTANMRAIGINQAGVTSCGNQGTFDACIDVKLSLTTLEGGDYNVATILQHEINEALGLGSSLGTFDPASVPSPEDLFRYQSAGVRSYSAQACLPNGDSPTRAFFSIDGGVTNIDEFNNCTNGGDFGDWISHSPEHVNDAYATPNGTVVMTAGNTETRALDVIGWTLTTRQSVVPEPSSFVLMAAGMAGLVGIARRKKNRG